MCVERLILMDRSFQRLQPRINFKNATETRTLFFYKYVFSANTSVMGIPYHLRWSCVVFEVSRVFLYFPDVFVVVGNGVLGTCRRLFRLQIEHMYRNGDGDGVQKHSRRILRYLRCFHGETIIRIPDMLGSEALFV